MISSQNASWEFVVPLPLQLDGCPSNHAARSSGGRWWRLPGVCTQREVLLHPEPAAHGAGPPAGVGGRQGDKPGCVSVTVSPPCSRAPPSHGQSSSVEKATLCVCLLYLALPGAFVVPWGRLPDGFVTSKKRSWRLEASKLS